MRRFTGLIKGQQGKVVLATLILLAFSVAFGGASRLHELRLALVELAALPVLVLLASHADTPRALAGHRFALGLLVALAAIPLLHLVPLPPVIWEQLPGREPLAQAFALAGLPVPWLPISLAPEQTWRSILALLPPATMFLAILVLPADRHRTLVLAILALTFASVIFGTAQLASGGNQLYPWPTTDVGSVAGLMANRNHFATLCLICLPFTLAAAARAFRHRNRVALLAFSAFAVLLVITLLVIRSRFGLLLLIPVSAASILMAARSVRTRPSPIILIGAVAAVVGLLGVAFVALEPALKRFDGEIGSESRLEKWPVVVSAAETYLPLGSGIGTFDPVYRSVEPVADLGPTFFNQAHNEYLETWLEAGWPGALLIIAFLVWYVSRTAATWRAPRGAQSDLARAASIAIAGVLLHSAFDYPLRTATIATLFALCCGLLELSRRGADSSAASSPRWA